MTVQLSKRQFEVDLIPIQDSPPIHQPSLENCPKNLKNHIQEMGDCSSRPSHNEVQAHLKLESSVNDHEFYTEPQPPAYIFTLRYETTYDPYAREEMRRQLTRLELDISNLTIQKERYCNYQEYGDSCVVLVEVQKGADLLFDQVCLQRPKPIVVVSTEPTGSQYETFEGDCGFPVWFSFFRVAVHPNFTTLVFRVLCNRRLGGRLELGMVKFSLDDLRDAKIREDWYPLDTIRMFGPDTVPRLKLRLQFVSHVGQLMTAYAEVCEDALEQATAAHARLKSVIESMSDYSA